VVCGLDIFPYSWTHSPWENCCSVLEILRQDLGICFVDAHVWKVKLIARQPEKAYTIGQFAVVVQCASTLGCIVSNVSQMI
jgi:hypothetical protein